MRSYFSIVTSLVLSSLIMAATNFATRSANFVIQGETASQVHQNLDIVFAGEFLEVHELKKGQVIEVNVRLPDVVQIPVNGKLIFTWEPVDAVHTPTPLGVTKTLHALDNDIWFLYSAPKDGIYKLKISPESRDRWPQSSLCKLHVSVNSVDSNVASSDMHTIIAAKPISDPGHAQTITLNQNSSVSTWNIYGSQDELDYFDNGYAKPLVGDWFKLECDVTQPALLTACLEIPDRSITGSIQIFRMENEQLTDYSLGSDPNDKRHQQSELRRSTFVRKIFPKQTLYLLVQSNSPIYRLQLRTLPIGPYKDPHMAVQQGMYNLIAQTDAWINHRPREADISSRCRESGNLIGTHCVACHVQSGLTGIDFARKKGYKVQNEVAYRSLVNAIYESVRPLDGETLQGNTSSVGPLHRGDGIASTRLAGFVFSKHDSTEAPFKLNSFQVVRAANLVLATPDPQKINGSTFDNFPGSIAPIRYSLETLLGAYNKTKDDKYQKAARIRLSALFDRTPHLTADIANRVLAVLFLQKQPEIVSKWKLNSKTLANYVQADCKLLLESQLPDGSWSATLTKSGNSQYLRPDPAATALALSALGSNPATVVIPSIDFGVGALLKLQSPSGLWMGDTQTGFAPTSYAIEALSLLFPQRNDLGDNSYQQSIPVGTVQTAWEVIRLGEAAQPADLKTALSFLGHPSKMVRSAAIASYRRFLLRDIGWTELISAIQSSDDTTRESAWKVMRFRFDGVLPFSRLSWVIFNALIDKAMTSDSSPAVRAWAIRAAWEQYVWNSPTRRTLNSTWVNLLSNVDKNELTEKTKANFNHALFGLNGVQGNETTAYQFVTLKSLIAEISRQLHEASPDTRKIIAEHLVDIASLHFGESGPDGSPGQIGYATQGSAKLFAEAIMLAKQNAPKERQVTVSELVLKAASGNPDIDLKLRLLPDIFQGAGTSRDLALKVMVERDSFVLPATLESLEVLHLTKSAKPKDSNDSFEVSAQLVKRIHWVRPSTDQILSTFCKRLLEYQTTNDDISKPDYILEAIAQNDTLHSPTMAKEYFSIPRKPSVSGVKNVLWVSREPGIESSTKTAALNYLIACLKSPTDSPVQREALKIAALPPFGSNFVVEKELFRLGTVRLASRLLMSAMMQSDRQFAKEIAAICSPAEKPRISEIVAFKNLVNPVLISVNRKDNHSCISCHANPGRVGSMPLSPSTDMVFSARSTLINYRQLRERLQSSLAKSIFLTKPLNHQDGTSDTHQGGTRFDLNSREYSNLLSWAKIAAAGRSVQKSEQHQIVSIKNNKKPEELTSKLPKRLH